jgi:predicted neuraminidase
MRRPGVRWFLIAAAIALNSLPLLRPAHRGAEFSHPAELPAQPPPSRPEPFFTQELINPGSPRAMSHVASICELPDGRLAAVWYAGSREGAPDVAVCFARLPRGQTNWSTPQTILTPERASRELHRAVRKVGNPVIFSDAGGGKLWLLYVTITLGGWSGSSLNLTTSNDGGLTWTPSRRLTLSPFFNLSELVRNRPVPLSDRGWVVPIYHECIGKFPELLWLREGADGLAATKSRITGGRSGFQPALVALGTNTALAFMRDCSPRRLISVAQTDDAARTWSPPRALDLPNPDSGLSAIRLTDGRILLAFNDSDTGRGNLRLAASADEGRTWKRLATLEEEPGAEFSYPFLLQARDGTIHLVYTWKRQAIRHVAFNAAWLNTRQSQPST